MISGIDKKEQKQWPRTIFDAEEWLDAWSRSTVEDFDVIEPAGPPLYSLKYSPFWRGYEFDLKLDPIWERPLLMIGSVYAVFGPAYLAPDSGAVAAAMDNALSRARETNASGVLVLNLPADAAEQWSAVRRPDASVRLDVAYHQRPGSGPDPVMGDVTKHIRTEWRRRWRRATEKGVRLVEETDPAPSRIAEIVALANGSAVKHGWPALYDETTVRAVLGVPGARLIRADWDGRTVAGFVALENAHQLHLWAGGMDHTVVREVSPYLFLLHELLSAGVERGWERVEFGRGNDEFKLKHGFSGVELWSLWYATRPGDVEVYQPKLAKLHDGLAQFQGL